MGERKGNGKEGDGMAVEHEEITRAAERSYLAETEREQVFHVLIDIRESIDALTDAVCEAGSRCYGQLNWLEAIANRLAR